MKTTKGSRILAARGSATTTKAMQNIVRCTALELSFFVLILRMAVEKCSLKI
jgi:hypothetical protein